jgi:uncharacterized protein
MAQVPESIKQIVEAYIKKLRKEIPLEKVILFGSYAKGNYHNDSDIDLAIFSDYFNGMRRVDGINYLLLRAMEYDIDLEPLPFTKADYFEKSGFAREVLKEGIEIPIN